MPLSIHASRESSPWSTVFKFQIALTYSIYTRPTVGTVLFMGYKMKRFHSGGGNMSKREKGDEPSQPKMRGRGCRCTH